MPQLGTITRLDARKVWSNEAADFTPWLFQNLSLLGEALGLELEPKTTEAPVGDFSLDLLAHDLGRDRTVIIENQLTATDHDHLGKLITYASGYNASTVVWITPEIRDEHRQALDWLNQHTDTETEFFLVLVEVLQINQSPPAVQFRPVAAPNRWRKGKVGEPSSAEPSSRGRAYQAFFQRLVDELREKHNFTRARATGPQNWYSFASGVGGVTYNASFASGGRCRGEIYIDLGEQEKNKALFDRLAAEQTQLETAFKEPLSWERLEQRRASRIAVYRPGTIDDPLETLEEVRAWLIDHLLRFKAVFGRRIAELVDEIYS